MASQSMEALPRDETLREATVEDYQAVLDIEPEGYQGHDYLPATFRSLVEGHEVKGYVSLNQGRVVGFLSTKIVDGGQTVLTSAGRVHPDHRGQGLYGRFKQRVLKPFVTSPSVQHLVFSVDNTNMENRGQSLRQYNVVMEKKVTWMRMEVDQVRAELSTGPVHSMCPPQPLTYQQLHSLLSQPPSHLSHLFPQQRILLNWEPYRVMADNTDVIANSCRDRVFVAAGAESIGKGNNFPVTLMSCGSHYPCQRGRMYDVDIFGSGSDAEMCDHLVWHLLRLTEIAKEKSAVMTVFADGKMHDALAKVLTHLPVQPVVLPFQAVFVLEAGLQ
ncbi:histidine N-acetyltransferase-like isoform X2 [Babylonia areolata]